MMHAPVQGGLCRLGQQTRIGRVGGTAVPGLGAIDFQPFHLAAVQQQGLAEPGRAQGMPLADPRADLYPPRAGQLVEIKRLVFLEHAEMHGVAGRIAQCFQVRARHTRQVDLPPRRMTKLE